MKDSNEINWGKRKVQYYDIFCAFIGFLLGISSTLMVLALLNS